MILWNRGGNIIWADYLKNNKTRMAKAIFFCVDIDHAERMRQALINENTDKVIENSKYVMRITGKLDIPIISILTLISSIVI